MRIPATVKPNNERVDEVHVDWDDQDPSQVESRLQQHAEKGLIEAAWRRRSANGRWHYRVRLARRMSAQEALQLRADLGDDPTRVRADEHRAAVGMTVDVLYDRKGGREAGEWSPVPNVL